MLDLINLITMIIAIILVIVFWYVSTPSTKKKGNKNGNMERMDGKSNNPILLYCNYLKRHFRGGGKAIRDTIEDVRNLLGR